MNSSDRVTPAGRRIVLDEECDCHVLGDRKLADGQLLELLTEGGWVSGHFRTRLHAETGYPVFEVHLGVLGERRPTDELEHAVIYLPPQAVLREPLPAEGDHALEDAHPV